MTSFLQDSSQGTDAKSQSRLGLSITTQDTQCGHRDSTQDAEAVCLKALESSRDDVSGRGGGVLVQHDFTVRCSMIKSEGDDARSATSAQQSAKELFS